MKITEANIQAEFFFWAKTHGLKVILEFKTPVGRLDVAVFNDDLTEIVAIVEVKRKRVNPLSKQIQRYGTIGVHVYGLWEKDKAEELVLNIKEIHKTGIGIPLQKVLSMKRLKRRREDRTKPRKFHPLDLCEEINFKS